MSAGVGVGARGRAAPPHRRAAVQVRRSPQPSAGGGAAGGVGGSYAVPAGAQRCSAHTLWRVRHWRGRDRLFVCFGRLLRVHVPCDWGQAGAVAAPCALLMLHGPGAAASDRVNHTAASTPEYSPASARVDLRFYYFIWGYRIRDPDTSCRRVEIWSHHDAWGAA